MSSTEIEVGDLVECTREQTTTESNIQFKEQFIALGIENDAVRYRDGFSLALKYCKLIKKAGKPKMNVTEDKLRRVEELNGELLALKSAASNGDMTYDDTVEKFTEIADMFKEGGLPFKLSWDEFNQMTGGNYLVEDESSYEEEEEESYYEEEESSYEDED